jgi:hypothetical protein
MGKLRNPRHERFAVECASMTPIGKAYELAGFRSKPEWCRPNGVKLSRNPQVAARIAELRKEFTASCGLAVEYLQAKLLPAAELNVVDLFDEENKLKPVSKLTRDQGAAIASIKLHENGEVAELRFVSKDSAVSTLLRSVGGIVDQHAHLHAGFNPAGLADRLNEARERMALTLAMLPVEDQETLLEFVDDLQQQGEGPSE